MKRLLAMFFGASMAAFAQRKQIAESIGLLISDETKSSEWIDVMNVKLSAIVCFAYTAVGTTIVIATSSLAFLLIPVGAVVGNRGQYLRLSRARTRAKMVTVLLNTLTRSSKLQSAHLANECLAIITGMIRATKPLLLTSNRTECHSGVNNSATWSLECCTALHADRVMWFRIVPVTALSSIATSAGSRAKSMDASLIRMNGHKHPAAIITSQLMYSGPPKGFLAGLAAMVKATLGQIVIPNLKRVVAIIADTCLVPAIEGATAFTTGGPVSNRGTAI